MADDDRAISLAFSLEQALASGSREAAAKPLSSTPAGWKKLADETIAKAFLGADLTALAAREAPRPGDTVVVGVDLAKGESRAPTRHSLIISFAQNATFDPRDLAVTRADTSNYASEAWAQEQKRRLGEGYQRLQQQIMNGKCLYEEQSPRFRPSFLFEQMRREAMDRLLQPAFLDDSHDGYSWPTRKASPSPTSEEQREASDPTTPGERLLELSRLHWGLHPILDQNPNLPSARLLESLDRYGTPEAWLNPCAVWTLLEKLPVLRIQERVGYRLDEMRCRWLRRPRRGLRIFDPTRRSLRRWLDGTRLLLARAGGELAGRRGDVHEFVRRAWDAELGHLQRDLKILDVFETLVPALSGGSGVTEAP